MDGRLPRLGEEFMAAMVDDVQTTKHRPDSSSFSVSIYLWPIVG